MNKKIESFLSYLEDVYVKVPSITGLSFLLLSGVTRRSTRESVNAIYTMNFDNVSPEGFLVPLFVGGSAYFIAKRLRRRKHDILLYMQAYQQSPAAILITDREGRIEYANPKFDEFFEMSSEEVIGQTLDVVNSEKVSSQIGLLDVIKGPGVWRGNFETKRDHQLYYREIDIYPIKSEKGNIIEYMCQIKDITERVNLEKRLKQQARVDLLTGLANRQELIDQGEFLLAESIKSGNEISLLYLDLDGFKQVNDNYGHNVGDDILKEVATRLVSCVRGNDLVARIGGDEFVIMLPHSTYDGTIDTAKRIIDKISQPYLDLGDVIATSIGIVRPNNRNTLEELLKAADTAMYKAKESKDIKYVFAENI